MKRAGLVYLLIVFALLLAACAQPAAPAPTSAPAPTAAPAATQAPAAAPTAAPAAATGGKQVIYHVAKCAGIDYFNSANSGMEKAAQELGNIELTYQSSANCAAEEQIKVLEDIVTKKPNAIIVSANDPQALVPVLKRAADAGIKVVTYDADVLPEARTFFANQATADGIGERLIEEVNTSVGADAKFAIISTSPTAPNQNEWIEVMKKVQAEKYPNMKLLDTRYGEDDQAKSRQQATDLITAFPDLQMIVAPTAAGCPGVADALEAANKAGTIKLTCLATPNGMRDYVKRGTAEGVYLWNVVDLGYMAMQLANGLVSGSMKAGDSKVTLGSLGEKEVGENGVIVLGPAFRFDKSNIDSFNF